MVNLHQHEGMYDTATKWFVRLRAENITDREHDQFFEWLFESSKHQQIFVDVLKLWDRLEIVKSQDLDKLLNVVLLQRQSGSSRANPFVL
jgi:ferric-dicitrate binding protein FerR (iron transport regulator)